MPDTVRGLASQALDLQLSLYHRFKQNGGEGQNEVMSFIHSMVKLDNLPMPHDRFIERDNNDLIMHAIKHGHALPPDADPAEKFAAFQGFRWWEELRDNLPVAPTYVLTEQMFDLTRHAGESIDTLTITEQDLPSDRGFLLLPRPLITLDKHDLRLSARVMVWWKSSVRMRTDNVELSLPSLQLMLFSSKADWQQDEYMQRAREDSEIDWEATPQYTIVHMIPILFHNSTGTRQDGSLIKLSLDKGGDPITHRLREDDDAEKGDQIRSAWMAFLKTFFVLVKQKVAVRQPERERHVARRWRRAGLPPEGEEIQVITLRKKRPRHQHEITDGTSIEWSHQWYVQGHWRDQFYPSCPVCSERGEACKQHEQLFIDTYVKGPEGKDLVIKDKVFVWKR